MLRITGRSTIWYSTLENLTVDSDCNNCWANANEYFNFTPRIVPGEVRTDRSSPRIDNRKKWIIYPIKSPNAMRRKQCITNRSYTPAMRRAFYFTGVIPASFWSCYGVVFVRDKYAFVTVNTQFIAIHGHGNNGKWDSYTRMLLTMDKLHKESALGNNFEQFSY